jgi:hypothetical protein
VIALVALLATAHADEPADLRTHVDLDALFTYSIGSQSALGGELLATVPVRAWDARRVTGTVDAGLLVGAQFEPSALAPWVDHDTTTALQTHLRELPSVGHTYRFGRQRQIGLGVHVYGGMVWWRSAATVDLDAQDVHGSTVVSRVVPDAGAFLRFTWRPHPVVGLSILAGAPFGVTTSYVVDLFTVGAGLTFRVR